jgi:hypothetical protein
MCEASNEVSCHTVAESLTIPCVEDIVLCVLGDNYLKVIKTLNL